MCIHSKSKKIIEKLYETITDQWIELPNQNVEL